MKTSIFKFKNIVLFFFTGFIYGQRPTHSPNPQDNTPIDLHNLFDVIVYVVLPLGMIIFYFLWRKQVKKRNSKKK